MLSEQKGFVWSYVLSRGPWNNFAVFENKPMHPRWPKAPALVNVVQIHFKQRNLKVICEPSRWTDWGLDYFFIPLISKSNTTFPTFTWQSPSQLVSPLMASCSCTLSGSQYSPSVLTFKFGPLLCYVATNFTLPNPRFLCFVSEFVLSGVVKSYILTLSCDLWLLLVFSVM